MQLAHDFSDWLTADINSKGVLDVDTVKGCEIGMRAAVGGCYGACYAATISKFRGINFNRSVSRYVRNAADAKRIERIVRAAPQGFFRIGTMGDPCHDWGHTLDIVEWLSPLAVPVIVTKHWLSMSDAHVARFVAAGAVLNTSISALDTPAQLAHRERQMVRYGDAGGHSVARIVSCKFNTADPLGAKLAEIQKRLFAHKPAIDNPLRITPSHELARSGLVLLTVRIDLRSERTVSLDNPNTYLGHCSGCKDLCGLSSVPPSHPRPAAKQIGLL